MASLQEISRAVRESAGEGATSTSRRRHRQGNRFFTCSLLPCQNFQDFPLGVAEAGARLEMAAQGNAGKPNVLCRLAASPFSEFSGRSGKTSRILAAGVAWGRFVSR